MSNTKITALTELATIDDTSDVVAIADVSASTTKKLSWSTIRTTIATYLASLTQTLTNKTLTSPKINEDVAVTATATELNYVDGVTSAIQTQLDSKGVGTWTDSSTSTGSNKTFVAPALGTPASGVLTNCTGTASGLTAGNVTTNANLTGVVTSTGNATAIADSALSIAKTSGLQTALDAKAPLASPTFTGTVTTPAEILNGQVNLDGTPASDHSAVGPVTNTFAAGYSSAIGDLVFFGSGGKWLEVDADAVATCNGLLGIALETKTDTQAMLVALPGSFVRDDTWNWTVGATLYAGETLGAMQETYPTGADSIGKVVGFAVTADVIFFNPSPDQQVNVA